MYFISDWAILNDLKSKQLQRILVFYELGEQEICLAYILLESYHSVYRRDRLKQRRNLLRSGQAIPLRCLPPTPAQLDEIAQKINAKFTLKISTQEVLDYLQNLASTIQNYYINLKNDLEKIALLNSEKSQYVDCCLYSSFIV